MTVDVKDSPDVYGNEIIIGVRGMDCLCHKFLYDQSFSASMVNCCPHTNIENYSTSLASCCSREQNGVGVGVLDLVGVHGSMSRRLSKVRSIVEKG
ncbi:hypothetical protein TNCV_2580441 [Trichonephila clavipes]|uniref:Uncharacterized protein n=1 Tax=Trichonephila clavipes TaxID=2585209 RepID=A0A8X6S5V8_TRICX|nr:hypothetical protein TNCV_2580441 [Trichonephila clavipes]